MRAKDLGMLFLLAALWGASFLFIRIAVPAVGPIVLAFLRVSLAALGLLIHARASRHDIALLGRWRIFLLIGLANGAIPYVLIATAELHLTAALAAILNATTPLFAALLGVTWLGERLTLRTASGLLCGFGGVAVLVGWSPLAPDRALAVAVLASLLAALSYAVAGIIAKRVSVGVPVLSMALGQQLGAAVLLLPLVVPIVATTPVTLRLSPPIALAIVALALLCTSVGYLLYFALIANVGPTRTLGVTFLVPPFGLLWGTLFLHEAIRPGTAIGLALILLSVLLTSGLQLRTRAIRRVPIEQQLEQPR
jgi:drug/metabolite transporter (DMT)-like permease